MVYLLLVVLFCTVKSNTFVALFNLKNNHRNLLEHLAVQLADCFGHLSNVVIGFCEIRQHEMFYVGRASTR